VTQKDDAEPNGFLLDTHTLFFLDSDPDSVPKRTLRALTLPSTRVFVSALTGWEMSIKHHGGRWPEVGALLGEYHRTLVAYGFEELPFQSDSALIAGALPPIHKDPFDRGLIAQAIRHGLHLVSQDDRMRAYALAVEGFTCRWDQSLPD
jgi:PIN domain nuclease of toxin-antitoxin system